MRLFRPSTVAFAHCDLPCGVYDPAQARIEAESVKAIMEKYQSNEDPVFRTRALMIKEQRADLVKHHLWVLWTDYFKPRTSRSTRSSTSCSTRPPSRPARPVAREAWTPPKVRSCSTTSPRSTGSSGRRRPPPDRGPRPPHPSHARGEPRDGPALPGLPHGGPAAPSRLCAAEPGPRVGTGLARTSGTACRQAGTV